MIYINTFKIEINSYKCISSLSNHLNVLFVDNHHQTIRLLYYQLVDGMNLALFIPTIVPTIERIINPMQLLSIIPNLSNKTVNRFQILLFFPIRAHFKMTQSQICIGSLHTTYSTLPRTLK